MSRKDQLKSETMLLRVLRVAHILSQVEQPTPPRKKSVKTLKKTQD